MNGNRNWNIGDQETILDIERELERHNQTGFDKKWKNRTENYRYKKCLYCGNKNPLHNPNNFCKFVCFVWYGKVLEEFLGKMKGEPYDKQKSDDFDDSYEDIEDDDNNLSLKEISDKKMINELKRRGWDRRDLEKLLEN